jgi:hypothetical protein
MHNPTVIPEQHIPAVTRSLQSAFNTGTYDEIHQPTGGLSTALVYRIVVKGRPYAHLDNIRVHQGDHVGAGQVVALDGDNGTAKNPHVHVGAYRGKKPLQIRWDLAAEGRIQTLAHPQQQPRP